MDVTIWWLVERFLEKNVLPAFKIQVESRRRGEKMRNYCMWFQSRGSHTLLKTAFYIAVCAWPSSKLHPFHICISQSLYKRGGMGDIVLPFCPLLASPLDDAGLEPLPLSEFPKHMDIHYLHSTEQKIVSVLLLATFSLLTSRSWMKEEGDGRFLNLMNK